MKNTVFITSIFCLLFYPLKAQENYKEANLLNLYNQYTELPREVAFLHLNKTTYIKGELLGFKAYVLDKNTKEASTETANLYVTISDTLGRPVKKQLFRVNQGTSQGNFEIDSLFSGGQYTIKAYTNWMRNFKEPNFFIQNFKVLDPAESPSVENTDSADTIEAHFLPEGGHLVQGIKNIVGVALKDSHGFGLSAVKGAVVDKAQNTITTFKTNDLGFAKFYLSPKPGENYTALLSTNGNSKTFPIESAEDKGITIELKDLKDKVALAFRTNSATSIDRRKGYQLAIHNGANLKIADVKFPKNQVEVLKVIPYADLDTGLTIFTLLDHFNEPILERLFYKHEGQGPLKSENKFYRNQGDSLLINIGYKNIDATKLNSFSISVLPKNTQSYTADHNMFSYTTLQPYVRGYVEKAWYYFEDSSARRRYDLDLLLLNQGWSSYNWQTIFNDPPDYNYDFEKGISFTANLRDKSGGQLLRYPSQGGITEVINLSAEETSFQRSALFPVEGDKVRLGEILPDGKVTKPKLVVLFDPSSIPPLNIAINALNTKTENKFLTSEGFPDEAFGNVERLDEVILTEKKEYTRLEKLKHATSGNVEIFEEKTRIKYRYFSNYISQRGYIVDEGYYEQIGSDNPGLLTTGIFRIVNRIQSTLSRGGAGNIPSELFADHDDAAPPGTRDQITSGMIPSIYLNGILLSDLSVLYRFDMSQVDYIEVDRYGLGGGMRAGGGIIKIVTDPSRALRGSLKFEKTYEEYALPLTFSKPKRYYTPKYNSYKNTFFREYGVIAWYPELSLNEKGELTFKIPDTGLSELQLGIEGIVNDRNMVSEILELRID